MKENTRAATKAKKEKAKDLFLIPSLDALIGDPIILSPSKTDELLAKALVIPEDYIAICDRISRGELNNRSDACQDILRHFSLALKDIHENAKHICDNGMEIIFVNSHNRRDDSSKEIAVRCLDACKQKYGLYNHYAILTGDNAMASIAYKNKIDVVHIEAEPYSGRREVSLPVNYYSQWEKQGVISENVFKTIYPNEAPLSLNEFVVFRASEGVELEGTYHYHHVGRVIRNRDGKIVIEKLRYIHGLPNWVYPRTEGQAMLLEAILAPSWEIPIVICDGTFGTGKTYLTTTCGYLAVTSGDDYDRIFVVPSEGTVGKRNGYLPGSLQEKIGPEAAPIHDNLRSMFKNRGDKKQGGEKKTPKDLKFDVENAIEKYFEFTALEYIGGRTIPDAFIIYDEFQALERYQVKHLLSRVGDGSKVICTGDRHQIYNPHLNETNNGIAYAASRLKGDSLAAVITMNEREVVRSDAARLIAKRMR